MKKLLLVLSLVLFTAAAAMATDSVEGLWKSIDEEGKVTAAWRIYQENGKLYGVIVTVPGQPDSKIADACQPSYRGFPVAGAVNTMTVTNTPFIFGLTMKAPGQWEGGNIIDPKDGKMYKCKITFRQADNRRYMTDVLEMRGEIGLGIGRSQLWQRTTEAEVAALRSN